MQFPLARKPLPQGKTQPKRMHGYQDGGGEGSGDWHVPAGQHESSTFLQVVRGLWPGLVSLILFWGDLEGRGSRVPSVRQPPSLWALAPVKTQLSCPLGDRTPPNS